MQGQNLHGDHSKIVRIFHCLVAILVLMGTKQCLCMMIKGLDWVVVLLIINE